MGPGELIFKLKSIVKIQFDLIGYPPLDSPRPLVKKAIRLMYQRLPRVSRYLSRLNALSHPERFELVILHDGRHRNQLVKRIFKIWIRKERIKRVPLLVLEGLLVLFTPLLAVIPGPNVFFYIPFLFLYLHWQSLRGLLRMQRLALQFRTTGRGG